MQIIRKNVFETNSSSMHCLVIASKDEFDNFMNGDLFAEGRDYKYFGETKLVQFSEVYDNYAKFCNDCSFVNTRVSEPLLRELMCHYGDFAGVAQDNFVTGFVIDIDKVVAYRGWTEETMQEIESLRENNELYDTIRYVEMWMDMQYSPLSFDMVRRITENFSTGYDDYESIPPTDQSDGTVKMHGVWYY